MKCPIDTTVDLVMADRNGVEIDYCPTCRGVWLDRGELDKIIERAATTSIRRADDDREDDRRHADVIKHKKKKSSFLGELFDF